MREQAISDVHSGTEGTAGVHIHHGVTTVTEACHTGRWITLRVNKQVDGTWTCKYIIHELGPTGTSTTTGHVALNYKTRDEAKAAALEAAHKEIDSRGPIGGPIK